MRTENFIRDCVNGNRTKKGWCSNVCFDGKHLYSYGEHYPLLVNIKGRWILNDAGYSATTAKHISWARYYADYVCAFKNDRNFYTEDGLIELLKESIDEECKKLEDELDNLSKRAFRQKQIKEDRLKELLKTYQFINQ